MSDAEPRTRHEGSRLTSALTVACVLLSAIVILLAVQNRALHAELAEALTRAVPEAPRIAPGGLIDPITVFDDSGTTLKLDWSANSRAVVLVYTSTCPACREARPLWDDLVARVADRGNVRVIGLQLDRPHPSSGNAPSEPAGARPFPVYGIRREGNEALLDLVPVIPGTFVIDARGAVREAYFGVPDDTVLDAVIASLAPGAR